MGNDVLTNRELNRATMARQLLLERTDRPIVHTVEHLVGMQAQEPLNPYIGLWSRLIDFVPEDLGQLVVDRELVRIVVMRGTIHLVSADDCLLLRPLMQPVMDAEIKRHSVHKSKLIDVDMAPVLAYADEVLADEPRTQRQLRSLLEDQFPELDGPALAYACRCYLALVQIPPRGVWGRTLQVTSTTAEAWLGRPLADNPSIDAVALRYLAAFGPASVADFASWSRLTAMREVLERLRPQLRTFRNESGKELFDLPDAPRPDPDTPAPTRVLPEYDNLLLSHADRSRFSLPDDQRVRWFGEDRVHGTILDDGVVHATWHLAQDKKSGTASMTIAHVPLPKKRITAIEAEARRFLDFYVPDVSTPRVLSRRLGDAEVEIATGLRMFE